MNFLEKTARGVFYLPPFAFKMKLHPGESPRSGSTGETHMKARDTHRDQRDLQAQAETCSEIYKEAPETRRPRYKQIQKYT
jgi:hypothetical protein